MNASNHRTNELARELAMRTMAVGFAWNVSDDIDRERLFGNMREDHGHIAPLALILQASALVTHHPLNAQTLRLTRPSPAFVLTDTQDAEVMVHAIRAMKACLRSIESAVERHRLYRFRSWGLYTEVTEVRGRLNKAWAKANELFGVHEVCREVSEASARLLCARFNVHSPGVSLDVMNDVPVWHEAAWKLRLAAIYRTAKVVLGELLQTLEARISEHKRDYLDLHVDDVREIRIEDVPELRISGRAV